MNRRSLKKPSKNVVKAVINVCEKMDSLTYLGEGAYATVFELNKRQVVKIVNDNSEASLKAFMKEAKIAKKIGEKKIGPKVYSYGTCAYGDGKVGYIVMQKLKDPADLDSDVLCKEKAQRQIVRLLAKLSKLKIGILDNNIENLMYHKKRFYLIDMGRVKEFSTRRLALKNNMKTAMQFALDISSGEMGWACDNIEYMLEEMLKYQKYSAEIPKMIVQNLDSLKLP